MTLYDTQRSIINLEKLIKFCEAKGMQYYTQSMVIYRARLNRMKMRRDKLIEEQVKQEYREKVKI